MHVHTRPHMSTHAHTHVHTLLIRKLTTEHNHPQTPIHTSTHDTPCSHEYRGTSFIPDLTAFGGCLPYP